MQSLDYVLAQSIGRGSFGSVYYAINKQSGEEVAIKVLNKKALEKQVFFNGSSDEAAETGVTQVWDEISFMRSFSHPFLMRFIDSVDQDDKIYIVTELAEGIVSSIHQRDVPTDTKLPDCILNLYQLHNSIYQTSTVLPLALHIAAGLSFIHRRRYVHGDIKPANILRTADGRYILGDFGLAKSAEKGRKYREIISPAFAAPESQGLTPENDVWAFGVCLFMLLYGEHPAVIAGQLYDGKTKVTHWGEVLIASRKEWKRALDERKTKMIEQLVDQNKQMGEFYKIKLNHEIISTTYGILTEVLYYCLINVEARVRMESVYFRLLDFYCKVQAAKAAKQFDKNFGQQLRDVAVRLQIDNFKHMRFLVALGRIKNDSTTIQQFQRIFQGKGVDFGAIDFAQFECIAKSCSTAKLIETIKQAEQQDSVRLLKNAGTPPVLGKIKDDDITPISGKFKKSVPSISLASKLVNLPPPTTEQADDNSQSDQFEELGGSFARREAKSALPVRSLAGQLANLPPPGVEEDDVESGVGFKKIGSGARVTTPSSALTASSQQKFPQFKKVGSAQSLASKLANIPPPEVKAAGKSADWQPHDAILKEESESSSSTVNLNMRRSEDSEDSDEVQLSAAPQTHLNARPIGGDAVEESDSDGALGGKFGAQSPLAQQATAGNLRAVVDESSGQELRDSDSISGDEMQLVPHIEAVESIYGKFKKPQSLASSMAAKLADLPPPTECEKDEEDGEDSGYMFIRAAKPKAKETIKFDIDLREKKDEPKPEQVDHPLTKRQSFNQILSNYLADDDVFALREKQNEERTTERFDENTTSMPSSQTQQFKTDLHQRSHYFLSTAEIVSLTISTPGQLPNNRQVKSLFKQISYANDEFKMKAQPFRYDHENDQAKILGLGSFACETLSTGKRSDGTNDFSDSDDDLVEFDTQGDEDFNNTFNEVFNIEEDEEDKSKELSAATAASLVNRGKGKFRTVKESEEEGEFQKFVINNVNIVEDDEASEMLEQPKSVLPFGFVSRRASIQNDDSDTEQFEMKLKDSSTDDEQLPSRSQPVLVAPKPFGFQLNMQALNSVKDSEAKIKLFENDDDEQIAHNGFQSARILNSGRGDQFLYSGQQSAKKTDIKEEKEEEQAQYLVSARAEHVDAVVLSPKQTIIFFHSLVNEYREINRMLALSKSSILCDDEYSFVCRQLDEVITAVVYDKASVLIITVEIFMARFEQWFHQLQQALAGNQPMLLQAQSSAPRTSEALRTLPDVARLVQTQFQEYEQFIDKSPAFLTQKSSWVAFNQISFFLQFQSRFKLLSEERAESEGLGVVVSINEQQYIMTPQCAHYYDVQIYLGLDVAECTPIVGLRHKVESRTVAVQQSYNCGKMLEDTQTLVQLTEKATVVTNKSASMSHLQNCFFRFKFLDLQLRNGLAEYQYAKGQLIKYSFLSISKQVIMPFALLDSFYDVLVNALQYSAPSTVRVSLFNADGAFYMIISDCGQGMLQERAEIIFNGQDADCAEAPEQPRGRGGIGGGIARLRLVVGLYSGVINVSSEEDCGCRIIVKIPMEDEEAKQG